MQALQVKGHLLLGQDAEVRIFQNLRVGALVNPVLEQEAIGMVANNLEALQNPLGLSNRLQDALAQHLVFVLKTWPKN